ncbi:MAG: NFACT RNA binding domain-containing protein [Balneolaceae bacterium]
MNYYELIYLKRELKAKFSGSLIEQANTPYKNFLEFFIAGEEDRYRLQFSGAPGNIALFADTYRGAKKDNTVNFFTSIYGLEIEDIEIAETDRWFSLVLSEGYKIRFRLFSNQANVFLSKEDQILEVFKEYDTTGVPVPEPKELDLFEGEISEKNTKNKLTTLNPMLPRQNLAQLIKIYNLDEAPEAEIKSFVKKITREMEDAAAFRLLENGNTTLLSEGTLPITTEKYYDSVNDLIAHRYKTHSHNQRLKQKKGELTKNLKRRIKRLQSTLKNMGDIDKGLDRAEKYEKWGHLLMAKAHLQNINQDFIEVDDLYNEGEKVKISLKKELDIAENAQRYYKKASSSKRSYEEAFKRIPKIKKEKKEHEELLSEIEEITGLWAFQDWEKEHHAEIQEFYSSEKKKDDESLPFYTLEIGSYPVWIGKNAKSNDKLVQQAHKEDVWMHARGVSGSHLVIRMGNEKGMPPKKVILEAASYAAFNSKARGSGLVPVIVTKLKYVRKPKGSPPGAVLVDKEEVEMVQPEKPQ